MMGKDLGQAGFWTKWSLDLGQKVTTSTFSTVEGQFHNLSFLLVVYSPGSGVCCAVKYTQPLDYIIVSAGGWMKEKMMD